MPLSAEQKAAVQGLKDVAATDAQEFATELQGANQGLHQHVWKAGFKEAEQRWKTRAEAAETAKTEAETAKTAAEQQLREAQEKQPDAAKINEQWQAKYDRDTGGLKEEVATLKQRDLKKQEANRVTALRAELTGLNPAYAKAVAVAESSRIRFKEDGSAELLEEGTEIPVQIPAGKTPYQVLAEEIKAKADPVLILAGGDSGSGTERGAPGTSGLDRNKIEERQRAEIGRF